jgi:protein-disulfide isomerase
MAFIGPDSSTGLAAAMAAGNQNKFWHVVELLYANQGSENSGWITDAAILSAAREAGADGQAVLAGMGAASVDAALRDAQRDATADKVGGTPTFVIERPPARSQQLNVPGLDPAAFVPALAAALQ